MLALAAAKARSFFRYLGQKLRREDEARATAADNGLPWNAGGPWFNGGYEAGQFGRNTSDWNPGTIGPNRLHQMDARRIRERVRDLDRNNPFASSAINAFLRNVVSTGILPKPRLQNQDQRSQWEDEWEEWGGVVPGSRFHCDVEGRRSIYELQAQILREVLVGGGCLVHFVERRIGVNGRRHPLAIELIPEERLADEQDSWGWDPRGNTDNGNPIVRGIEIDKETGEHVAYWVKPTQVNDVIPSALIPIRIPASRAQYVTLLTLTGQVRGFSLLAPVVIWLQRLGTYVDNEMIASGLKSAWAYMLKQSEESPDVVSMLNEDDGTALVDAGGNRVERVATGAILRGRPGDELSAIGPNVPQGDSVPWITLIQQSIAMGLDISEIELTRDYSRVNFSSARAAANRDRKTYRYLQEWFINHCLNFLWERFVRLGVSVLLPGFPAPQTYLENPRDWLRMKWRTPGWPSVNPLDDANSNRIRLQDGTTTREAIVASEGEDWEEIGDQLELENERFGVAGAPPEPTPAETPAAIDDSPPQNAPASARTPGRSNGNNRSPRRTTTP